MKKRRDQGAVISKHPIDRFDCGSASGAGIALATLEMAHGDRLAHLRVRSANGDVASVRLGAIALVRLARAIDATMRSMEIAERKTGKTHAE